MNESITEQLSEYETARWVALMDCVALIGDTADKTNTPFDQIQFNHPAMMRYVDEISDQVARNLKN
jgi:hypothetical protein